MNVSPIKPAGKPNTHFNRKHHSQSSLSSKDSPWLSLLPDTPMDFDVSNSKSLKLCNTMGKNDYDLIALSNADLVLFNGIDTRVLDLELSDASCLCTFYEVPQIPSIAIAIQDTLYVYSMGKQTNKFMLPALEPDPLEVLLWKKLIVSQDPFHEISELKRIRESGLYHLSQRTHDLLAIDSVSFMHEFISSNASDPLSNQAVQITCLSSLSKRDASDDTLSSILIAGTSEKILYLLNTPKLEIIEKFQLASPIVTVDAYGSYYGEFRIFVLCKDYSIYVLNKVQCKVMLQSQVLPNYILVYNRSLLVSFMNKMIISYQETGQRNYKLTFPCGIVALEKFDWISKRVYGYIVALDNKQIHLYNGKNCLYTLSLSDIVAGVQFGSFGREESALVSVLRSGKLSVYILKRNANLDSASSESSDSFLTKKSKAYADCIKRERLRSQEIFQIYQTDLLRTKNWLEYTQLFNTHCITAQECVTKSISISVEIQGIQGSQFYNLIITTKNQGYQALYHLGLLISIPATFWKLDCDFIRIPFLAPNREFKTKRILENETKSETTVTLKLILASRESLQMESLFEQTIQLYALESAL